MQRSSLLLALALALAACLTAAQTTPAVAPVRGAACTESGGVKINLSGNYGFCYLVGQRMRKGSIFAQCKDGVLTCFTDEGIPDKPRQSVPCIPPAPGLCGSLADATPAPTPAVSNSSTITDNNSTTTGNSSEPTVSVGDEANIVSHVRGVDLGSANPSVLVSGNLAIAGLDDSDDDTSNDA